MEEGIVEFSRNMPSAIIAIATHGYGGIVHLINGSIAEDISNHNQNLIWTYAMKKVEETSVEAVKH